MAKVAVITGYYNRASALEMTLDSLRLQTCHDIEIVVFDDASSDGTSAQLDALLAKWQDPRFTIRRHNRNLGFVRGLIDAIAATDSEYIAIQGSGDVSHSTRIEKQVARLDADATLGMVGCQFTEVQESGAGIRRIPMYPDANGITLSDLIRRNVYFSHGDVMYRREAYDAAGGYRAAFKYSQDYDLWLRIMKSYPVGTVLEDLYERHVRFDGVSYTPSKLVAQECYSILARKMVLSSSEAEDGIYQTLKEGDPVSLVDPADPYLQTRVRQAALRAVTMHRPDDAAELIGKYIKGAFYKPAFRVISAVFGNKAAGSLARSLKGSPLMRKIAFFIIKNK
jgi:hypothetical protein